MSNDIKDLKLKLQQANITISALNESILCYQSEIKSITHELSRAQRLKPDEVKLHIEVIEYRMKEHEPDKKDIQEIIKNLNNQFFLGLKYDSYSCAEIKEIATLLYKFI